MRILYLNLDRGIPVRGDKGASVHVRAFVTAATACGHDVALACATVGEGNPPPPARILHVPDRSDDAALTRAAKTAGLGPRALADPTMRRELARLAHDRAIPNRLARGLSVAGFKPDLIYERHALFHSAGVTLAARLRLPRVLEVNAPLIEEQRRFRGLALEAAARTAETESYRGADAIVAVSTAVADQVSQVLGRRARVHVIPNGVDRERYADVDVAGQAIRARFGIGAAPVAGFIGSFKAWHGVADLLEAFAGIAKRHPDLRLLAVGDGPERATVEARVAALGLSGRVILPGRIPHDEIPGWLGAMDFTVAPYLPQPDFYFSPLKIFESLAAGRPVIAPATGAIRTIVDDEKTGLLYHPGDIGALRTALAAMASNASTRAMMARQARSSPAVRDWQDVVRDSLALVAQHVPCNSAA